MVKSLLSEICGQWLDGNVVKMTFFGEMVVVLLAGWQWSWKGVYPQELANDDVEMSFVKNVLQSNLLQLTCLKSTAGKSWLLKVCAAHGIFYEQQLHKGGANVRPLAVEGDCGAIGSTPPHRVFLREKIPFSRWGPLGCNPLWVPNAATIL